MDSETMGMLISEVVRYVIFKNYQQPGVPIKRRELTALITEKYKQRALPAQIIEAAKKKLAATFGFELKALDRSLLADAGRQSQDGGEDNYVLRSTVPGEMRKEFVETEETAAGQSFTVVVLAILQLSPEKMPEDVLFFHLRKLGIDASERHAVFGNIKDALDTAIKQRYILRAKPTSHENDNCTYELAERALEKDMHDRVKHFIQSQVRDST